MPTWHVPLVPVSLPVLLLGQHMLLLEGQRRPLLMLQLTRDLSVVHCQGPVGRVGSGQSGGAIRVHAGRYNEQGEGGAHEDVKV
jgi:hypothetical protein